MIGNKMILSREQQSAFDFLNATAVLQQIANDGHGTGLLSFTNALIEAGLAFGTAELHARTAERLSALDMQASRTLNASKMAARSQDRGFEAVANARTALARFQKELATYPKDAEIGYGLDRAQEGLREALADMELKAADVVKLDGVIRQCFDTIRAKGAAGLPDYLAEQIDALERVRRQDDRGASENIAIWKVVLIAAALGVWVWGFFKCKWWGSCDVKWEGMVFCILVAIACFC